MKYVFLLKATALVAAALCLSSVLGCEPVRDVEATPGTSQSWGGVIHYEGARKGTLRIAAFPSFPPRGRPLAQVEIAHPQFPQAYTFNGLQSGRVFVLAVLDVDPMDGEKYHPTVDPGGAFGSYRFPEAVTLESRSAKNELNIELVDPSADSEWIRPGYR